MCLLLLVWGGGFLKKDSPNLKTYVKKQTTSNINHTNQPNDKNNIEPTNNTDEQNNYVPQEQDGSYLPDFVMEYYQNNKQAANQVLSNDIKTIPSIIPAKKDGGVPVLYYHAVDDIINGVEELFVSPAEFEQQMKYLKDNNYTVISFDELPMADKYKNPVIITFDDGYEDNYTNAYPILKEFNFKATIFLCTNVIDKPQYLKKDQISNMSDLISIQSHTISHTKLSTLKIGDLDKELEGSQKILTDLTGKPVNVIAYPFGDYNKTVLQETKKYYSYAVTIDKGFYYKNNDRYQIKRIYVPRELDIKGFAEKINGIW
ncbi:MAG: polysaccharide deacetylase family protein [Bacillota bacterium]|nr:polysaccharide deacetylase family protein [Bacillota bacterium]